jgi:hypothetical protein
LIIINQREGEIEDFRFQILDFKKTAAPKAAEPRTYFFNNKKEEQEYQIGAGLTRPPPTGGGANQNHKILSLSLESNHGLREFIHHRATENTERHREFQTRINTVCFNKLFFK